MTIGYDPETPWLGEKPSFPPLLRGVEVATGVDPFQKAVSDCGLGRAEMGDLYWSPDEVTLRTAVVLEPDVALKTALPIMFAVANGMNDCIGALAPPEVGMQHIWPDGIKINGAWCGTMRAASATRDPEVVPDWLVIGVSLSRKWAGGDPGDNPEMTALSEEGCSHLSLVRLIESWSRHMMTWVNRYEDEGYRPIFDGWLSRAEGYQKNVAFAYLGQTRTGVFLGLDEDGAMLLREPETGTVNTMELAAVLDNARKWPPEEIRT